MSDSIHLRLGTRASQLARWQAEWVAARLNEADGVEVELVPISTSGDRDQRGPIAALGTQGVFTKELQRALLADEIDLAVHSLKDLPTDAIEGLALAAVPARGPVGDVLITKQGGTFADLPQGAVVGTGSLRRRAQLLHARGDLQMNDLRGNVDTRLSKVRDGDYDAIVLAEAGLVRLGLDDAITERLPVSLMLPAVGQGALGIEARAGDAATCELLAEVLDDTDTHAAVLAERALLATLRGGCLAPVGGLGIVENEQLHLTGVVLSGDGKQRIESRQSGGLTAAAEVGRRAAEELIEQGASKLIADSRQ